MKLKSKVLEKLKKRHTAFRNHPLTKNNSFQALFRYLYFHISQSLIPKTKIFNWIGGLKFYAKKGDAGIVANIYFKLFDYEDSMFLINNLKENNLFVDVGANLGHYTLLAAGISKANVIAFEPIITTYEKLEKNVKLNNLQNKIQLYNIGIGDVKGILQFTTNYDVMNRVALENESEVSNIQVKTLNETLNSLNPDFLKIDVEGYEYFVLKGASEILKKKSLKYILIELNNSSEKFGHTDDEIHQFLLAYDFVPISYSVENNNFSLLPSYNKHKFNTIYIKKNLL